MNWEQKLDALQALGEHSLRMSEPGKWLVSCRLEIGGDGLLSSDPGRGATPQEAVEDHWQNYADPGPPYPKYVAVGGLSGNRKNVRWNGFMWREVTG